MEIHNYWMKIVMLFQNLKREKQENRKSLEQHLLQLVEQMVNRKSQKRELKMLE